MRSDEALVAAAELIRSYHRSATLDSRFRPDISWRFTHPEPSRWEVICHNDIAPYNLVYRADVPVSLIDFDAAGQGPSVWDVAHAAYRLIPLSSDRSCHAFGWSEPPDRGHRLSLFLERYGLFTREDRKQFLDCTLQRIERLRDSILQWASLNDPGVTKHLKEDHVGGYSADIVYMTEHVGDLNQVILQDS